MVKVAIVGAGVMGSALAIPPADSGCRIALCGTEFDRTAIDRILADRWHPALQMALPEAVQAYHVEDIGESLDGARILVIGVISGAIRPITRMLGPFLAPGMTIVNVAKGLEVAENGSLRTLPEAVRESLPERLRDQIAVVAIAGPCKALELAARHPTSVVFAGENAESLEQCVKVFATSYYRIELTSDVRGVEVSAALKNGYAIGMGICDGLERSAKGTMDNLRAAVFNRAVAEMVEVARTVGGRPESAYGLAGLGDLFVTLRQGRNLTLGQLLGSGLSFAEAMKKMQGATVEGVESVRLAHLALKSILPGTELQKRLPLLDALHGIMFRQAPVSKVVDSFCTPVIV